MKKAIFILFISILSVCTLYGQSVEPFAGIVVDKDGRPVVGATVCQNDDVMNYTVTDDKGRFALQVESGHKVRISFPNGNYILVRTEGDGQRTIVFDDRATRIDYGFDVAFNKIESTAAVNTVSDEVLEKTRALNPENSLYGMLPGLAVMQNGGSPWFGASPSMFIRGKGTYKNANILVLVDGVERPFSSLAMEDVESVSVLKDAAALALYGQRGANGVLMVKTKRGQYGGKEVKVNYQHGFTRPIALPDMVDGYTYAKAMNEAYANDGLGTPMFSEYDMVDIANGTYPYLLPDVDWFKESLRSFGSQDNVSVSFSGGSKTVAYYALVDYNHEAGIYKPVDYNDQYSTQLKRHVLNVSTKLDARLTKSTTLSVNLTGNIAQYRRPGGPQHEAIFGLLYKIPSTAMPIKAEDGTWGGNPLYITDNVSSNPVGQIAGRGYVQNHSRRLAVDGTLRQELGMLVPGLSADVRVSYDNMAEYGEQKSVNDFVYTIYEYYRDPETHSIPESSITRMRYGTDALMKVSSSFNTQFRHALLQGRVNYVLERDLHSLNASLGYYQEKYIGNGQYHTYMHQSVIGHVHYSYDDRFIGDLAMSYCGSNYLAPGDRFRFYPSLSGAWIISNENFMKGSVADLLKVRASFGVAGNDLIDQNLFIQGYTAGDGYPFKDANTNSGGRLEGQMATEKVSPESAKMFNFGVDFSLWHKFTGNVDVFYTHRTGILADSGNTTSGILGVAAPMICSGIVDNAGVDVGLGWADRKGDFSYNIGVLYSFSRNKIVNQEEEYRPYDYLKRTGNRVGQPFGLISDGYFANDDEVKGALPQWGTLRPGDARYKDQNGDRKIDQDDFVAISSPTEYPGMYFSLSFGFEWRGLGMDVLFQGAADYGITLNTVGLYRGLVDNTNISQYMYDNSWSAERDTPARFPRLTSQKNDNNYQNSDIWTVNNPFLKLRNLNIYYRFPQRWMSKIKLKEMCLFLNGSNLFTIDRLPASDAEYIAANYPLMATYTIGLNFKF